MATVLTAFRVDGSLVSMHIAFAGGGSFVVSSLRLIDSMFCEAMDPLSFCVVDDQTLSWIRVKRLFLLILL